MDWEARKRRKADIVRRAGATETMWSHCRIIGCGKPPTAKAGKGVNRMYCRAHEDHFERHGSYTKGSYTAAQLAEPRLFASAWLKDHVGDMEVQLSTRAVEALYATSGRPVEAFRLRGLSPQQRALAIWARLREKRVDPTVPLLAWLSIEEAVREDLQADSGIEYKRVQAAKLIHRLAGGTHKKWERETAEGRVDIQRLDKYPQSRGLVLRYVGEQLQRAAEPVTVLYLAVPKR
jgi:hypothetical protein